MASGLRRFVLLHRRKVVHLDMVEAWTATVLMGSRNAALVDVVVLEWIKAGTWQLKVVFEVTGDNEHWNRLGDFELAGPGHHVGLFTGVAAGLARLRYEFSEPPPASDLAIVSTGLGKAAL